MSLVFEYYFFVLDNLRYDDYNKIMNTDIFSSASCWPCRPLRAVAQVYVGMPIPRHLADERAGATVAVINVRDLSDGRLGPLGTLEVRRVARGQRIDRYRVEAGDVVLTCRGTQLKIALVPEDMSGAVISSNLIAVRPGSQLVPWVLFAFLQGPQGQTALLRQSRSSNLGIALSPKSVGQIVVPVPPMEIQERIAALMRVAEENYVVARQAAEHRRLLARAVANNLLAMRPPTYRPKGAE